MRATATTRIATTTRITVMSTITVDTISCFVTGPCAGWVPLHAYHAADTTYQQQHHQPRPHRHHQHHHHHHRNHPPPPPPPSPPHHPHHHHIMPASLRLLISNPNIILAFTSPEQRTNSSIPITLAAGNELSPVRLDCPPPSQCRTTATQLYYLLDFMRRGPWPVWLARPQATCDDPLSHNLPALTLSRWGLAIP